MIALDASADSQVCNFNYFICHGIYFQKDLWFTRAERKLPSIMLFHFNVSQEYRICVEAWSIYVAERRPMAGASAITQ